MEASNYSNTLNGNEDTENGESINMSNINLTNVRYKKDQWSPINPDGKRCYDADFLMSFQNKPLCQKRPDNLPDVGIVLPTEICRPTDKYIKLWEENLKSQEESLKCRENSIKLREQSLTQREKVLMSREKSLLAREKLLISHEELMKAQIAYLKVNGEHVKLHEENVKLQIENPSKSVPLTNAELYKRIAQIMKRLIPSNFNILLGEIKLLITNNMKNSLRIIDMIFDKIKVEPFHPVLYGSLLKEISSIRMFFDGMNKSGGTDIKKIILKKCESEFKNISESMNLYCAKLKAIEECVQPEKKNLLQLRLKKYEDESRIKFIKFVKLAGELYKKEIILDDVMLEHLKILTFHGEINLECLCELLNIIGKEMEIYNRQSLQCIFDTIQEVLNTEDDNTIDPKVLSMLENIIKLRNPDYEPWSQDLDPKIVQRIFTNVSSAQSANLTVPFSILCSPNDKPIALMDGKSHQFHNKVKRILKEFMVKNFIKCVEEIKGLPCESSEQLWNIITVIHHEAMEEPNTIPLLATLCKELSSIQACSNTSTKGAYGTVMFQNLLLNKCQYEFQKGITNLAECNHNTENKIHCSIKNYESHIKLNAIKNIRLIGELFKQKMIDFKIIMNIISILYNDKNENNLECLCVLLTITGKFLEVNYRQNLQYYFDGMNNMVENQDNEYSSEIRCKLQDVIHLRNPKWSEKQLKNIYTGVPIQTTIRPAIQALPQIHNNPYPSYQHFPPQSYSPHVQEQTSYFVQSLQNNSYLVHPKNMHIFQDSFLQLQYRPPYLNVPQAQYMIQRPILQMQPVNPNRRVNLPIKDNLH